MSDKAPRRRGYALMLTIIFCVLFGALMAVALRRTASTIYSFTAHANQLEQDQGALMALADAMRALEVGPPPFDPGSSVYTCYDQVNVAPVQNLRIQSGPLVPKWYIITYTATGSSGTPPTYTYTVQVAAGPSTGPPDGSKQLNVNSFCANGP